MLNTGFKLFLNFIIRSPWFYFPWFHFKLKMHNRCVHLLFKAELSKIKLQVFTNPFSIFEQKLKPIYYFPRIFSGSNPFATQMGNIIVHLHAKGFDLKTGRVLHEEKNNIIRYCFIACVFLTYRMLHKLLNS